MPSLRYLDPIAYLADVLPKPRAMCSCSTCGRCCHRGGRRREPRPRPDQATIVKPEIPTWPGGRSLAYLADVLSRLTRRMRLLDVPALLPSR